LIKTASSKKLDTAMSFTRVSRARAALLTLR
jgi:hypothetical protein